MEVIFLRVKLMLVFSVGLTNIDIAHIFLSTIAMTDFQPKLRKLDLREYWEVSRINIFILLLYMYIC